MRRLFHPSRRRLQAWLEDTAGTDDKLDSHISTCEVCAQRLEELSQPTGSLSDALRTLLAPPTDLQPRLRAGIATKMQTREDLRLLVELMGLPMQTLQTLMTPPPAPPDQPTPDDPDR